MKRNLLIASGLIIFVALLIGFLFFIPVNMDDSTIILNSTDDENVNFDNSTPEATAISIAKLYPGVNHWIIEDGLVLNASLTSDGKYWIIRFNNSENSSVTVDPKTLMSKTNMQYEYGFIPSNTWISLDYLKAYSIAEVRCSEIEICGRPQKIVTYGKEIWKVPVYFNDDSLDIDKPERYIYVDIATEKQERMWIF